MTVDSAHGQAEQQSDEDIPPLTHAIATIFVPLTEDLLEPIEPAKDKVERLEQMVASLDANEKKVRDNIVWTYEREARRHLAAVKSTGALSTPHQPELMSWEEAEKHIRNMEAPANPSMVYHLPPEKIAEFKAYDHARPNVPFPDHLGPHGRASREIVLIANREVGDLESYSNYHIKDIRDRLNVSLEREKRASASFDRPRP